MAQEEPSSKSQPQTAPSAHPSDELSSATAYEASVPAFLSVWLKPMLWLLGLVIVLGVTQLDALQSMVSVWMHSKTFNHCALIPLLTMYLIYTERERWLHLQPSFSVKGLLLLLASSLVLLISTLAQVNAAQHFALVISVIAIVWLCLGDAFFRSNRFALIYLLFAVPFGEFLVPGLQDITAEFAVGLVRLIGIPVFMDGRLIEIPTGSFLVAEACSGISYLIAAFSLGTLFAHMYYVSLWRKVLFSVLSLIVPIVANGIRAFLIIYIAHKTNNEYAVGVDHLIYGWIFFGVVIFLMFAVGQMFAEKRKDAKADLLAPVSAPRSTWRWWGVVAMILLFLNGQLTARKALEPAGALNIPVSSVFKEVEAEPLSVKLVGAQQVHHYSDGEMIIVLGYFPVETRYSELVTSSHQLFDAEHWNVIENPNIALLGESLRAYRLKSVDQRFLSMSSFSLFASGGPTSDINAKVHQLLAQLQGKPAPALKVVLIYPVSDASTLKHPALEAWLQELQSALEQVGGE